MNKLLVLSFIFLTLTACVKESADFKLLKVEESNNFGGFVAYVRDDANVVDDGHNYILCLPEGKSAEDFVGVKSGYRAESVSVKPIAGNENTFSIVFQQLYYSGNESLPIVKADFLRLLPQGKNVECRLIARSYVTSPRVLGKFHIARADLLKFFDK
ncbi:hypothetical protein [Chromobacterium violaceum]|uniref:hypothetical protein n=1 Tax=Chromobacterium violaceum TaxID=536 RepID=UPI003CF8C86A